MEIEEENYEEKYECDSLEDFVDGRKRALTLSTINSSIETPVYC